VFWEQSNWDCQTNTTRLIPTVHVALVTRQEIHAVMLKAMIWIASVCDFRPRMEDNF